MGLDRVLDDLEASANASPSKIEKLLARSILIGVAVAGLLLGLSVCLLGILGIAYVLGL